MWRCISRRPRCSGSEGGGTSPFASRLIGDRAVIRAQESRSRNARDLCTSVTSSEHHVTLPQSELYPWFFCSGERTEGGELVALRYRQMNASFVLMLADYESAKYGGTHVSCVNTGTGVVRMQGGIVGGELNWKVLGHRYCRILCRNSLSRASRRGSLRGGGSHLTGV